VANGYEYSLTLVAAVFALAGGGGRWALAAGVSEASAPCSSGRLVSRSHQREGQPHAAFLSVANS
jgi:hypothetical protein